MESKIIQDEIFDEIVDKAVFNPMRKERNNKIDIDPAKKDTYFDKQSKEWESMEEEEWLKKAKPA